MFSDFLFQTNNMNCYALKAQKYEYKSVPKTLYKSTCGVCMGYNPSDEAIIVNSGKYNYICNRKYLEYFGPHDYFNSLILCDGTTIEEFMRENRCVNKPIKIYYVPSKKIFKK